MMDNKEHEKYINHFKDISSITTVILKINQMQLVEKIKTKI